MHLASFLKGKKHRATVFHSQVNSCRRTKSQHAQVRGATLRIAAAAAVRAPAPQRRKLPVQNAPSAGHGRPQAERSHPESLDYNLAESV